jgi:HEAT repeat protein
MDHHDLISELMGYLEHVIEQCSSLPDFYPPGVTFQDVVQPIEVLSLRSISGWPSGMQPPQGLDPARTERLRWAGYDWDRGEQGHPRFRWQRHTPFQRQVILGQHGMGKTWWLHTIGLQVAVQQLERLRDDARAVSSLTVPLCFPAEVVAQALTQEPESASALINALLQLLHDQLGWSTAACAWVQPRLFTRRTVLLLDDLDQVSPAQEARFFAALQLFCLNSQATVLATAHPSHYTGRPFLGSGPLRHSAGYPVDWHEMLLASFGWNQVRGFVLSWFTTQPDRGEQVLETFHANPFLRTLTRLPVFLPWLCHLAALGQPVPSRRVELYEAILHALPSHEQPQAHPIFQDYQEARALARLPFDVLWARIRPHLWCDPDWENRLLLLAGCLEQPMPFLRALLAEESDAFAWILLLAGRCLAEMDPTRVDPTVVQALTDRLLVLQRSGVAPERLQAREILERIARPVMLKHYVAQVPRGADRGKQLEAISRLGAIGDVTVVPVLLEALQQPAARLRESDELSTLYRALEQLGGWEAARFLLALWQKCPYWYGHPIDPGFPANQPRMSWEANEALWRIHASGLEQELLRLWAWPAPKKLAEPHKILARRGDRRAAATWRALLEEQFPDEEAICHWLELVDWHNAGDVRRWLDLFLRVLPSFATRQDQHAYSLLLQVLKEFGGPRAEQALAQIFVPSIQQTKNLLRIGRLWEGVERLLEEESIAALLQHPDPRVRKGTLLLLGNSGDPRARDGLLALLRNETVRGSALSELIVPLGRVGGMQAGDALLAVLPRCQQDVLCQTELLAAVTAVMEQPLAETLLSLAAQEEATNRDYLEGLLHRDELTGTLRRTAATILGLLGDPRGTTIASELMTSPVSVRYGAAQLLCLLTRMGDEQALEVLRRFLLDEHPALPSVWRTELFLRTGPGMEIVIYWTDVWTKVDSEGRTQRLVSQQALERLVRDNDPGQLAEELLALWSEETTLERPLEPPRGRNGPKVAVEEPRRSAVYQLLASCAPLLTGREEAGKPSWRQRLAHLTPEQP